VCNNGSELCLLNQCLSITPGCGPQSCNGCCSQGVCLAGTDNSACGAGGGACQGCLFLCFSGACLGGGFGGSSGDAGVGDPCTSDNDCMVNASLFNAGSCIQNTETDGGPSGWPGGYCAPICFSGSCPGNGLCLSNGYCYEPCNAPGTGRSTCRQGYVCGYQTGEDGGTLVGQPGVCEPNCHNAGRTCDTGTHCSSVGYCQ
jgi:hypothetical protein